MFSNMKRYKHALYAGSLKENTTILHTTLMRQKVMLMPGFFPQCLIHEKDCNTLANMEKHIIVGFDMNQNTSILCKACRSIICQECARRNDYSKWPNCVALEEVDMLPPFVFCDKRGKRAALISGALPGEASYMLLDKKTVLFQHMKCGSINCSSCLQDNNVCSKCGASDLGFLLLIIKGEMQNPWKSI